MSQFAHIRIIVAGPVSAGKSTLLNSIMRKTFSEMNRKKTTMLPQEYIIVESGAESSETIARKNRDSNSSVLKARESGKFTQADFKEIIHRVEPIEDFIKFPKGCTYSVVDMPGLNCGGGDDMYFNYINSSSKTLDVYILVFDINSGMNTTDEVNILQRINDIIKQNGHGYVHVIINKCDGISFSGDKFEFQEEEMNELYGRCTETVHKYLRDCRGAVSISPLCSSELYVYRTMKYDLESIEEKHLDRLIQNECGKAVLRELKTVANKRKYMEGKLAEDNEQIYSRGLEDTGYQLFIRKVQEIICKKNYCSIVNYHVHTALDAILAGQITFDDTSAKLAAIDDTLNKLLKDHGQSTVPTHIMSKIQMINTKIGEYLDTGLGSYTAGDVKAANNTLAKITAFVDALAPNMRKLFDQIFSPIKAKVSEKRYVLLNAKLAEQYDSDIYTELITSGKLDLAQFEASIRASIIATAENPCSIANTIRLIREIQRVNAKMSYADILHQLYKLPKWSYVGDGKISYKSIQSIVDLVIVTPSSDLEFIYTMIKNCTINMQDEVRIFFIAYLQINMSAINVRSKKIGYVAFKICFENNKFLNLRGLDYDSYVCAFTAFDELIGILCHVCDPLSITNKSESTVVEPTAATAAKEITDTNDVFAASDDAKAVYEKANQMARNMAAETMAAADKRAARKGVKIAV